MFAIGGLLGWMVHEVNPYIDLDRAPHPREAYGLPQRLIIQQASPDGAHVAQVLYHEPSEAYYLAIVNRPQRTRLLLDTKLSVDPGSDQRAMKLTWRGNRTVLLEIARGTADRRLNYAFDLQTSAFERTGQPAEPEPVMRDEPRADEAARTAQLRTVTLHTRDDRLLLYRQIPLGVSYQALRAALPDLSSLRHEAGSDLTEAIVTFDVFGYPGQVEFNFKNEQLYSYQYSATLKDAAEMEALYTQLQSYYSGHFGAYQEERVRESSHYAVVSSHWQGEKVEVAVVNNITPGSYLLTWALRPRN